MAFTYAVICGLSWHWILGLPFDWWKLPIIGAFNGVLNMLVAFSGRKIFEHEDAV